MNDDVASMDATTIQVLDEPGRDASTKSYMYCFRGGGEHDKVILYEYNDRDHQVFIDNWLESFSGHVHSDADSFFNKLYNQDDVHSVLCNAHARRKFEPIAKASKQASKQKGCASTSCDASLSQALRNRAQSKRGKAQS